MVVGRKRLVGVRVMRRAMVDFGIKGLVVLGVGRGGLKKWVRCSKVLEWMIKAPCLRVLMQGWLSIAGGRG